MAADTEPADLQKRRAAADVARCDVRAIVVNVDSAARGGGLRSKNVAMHEHADACSKRSATPTAVSTTATRAGRCSTEQSLFILIPQ
jgi:hypothetical protein